MAMNVFNGKGHFPGPCRSETLRLILKKWHNWDPTSNFGVNRFKGACLRKREVVAVRRLFFTFLGSMRIAETVIVLIKLIQSATSIKSYHLHFYREMHVVLARYCYRNVVRPSVRPSVCLSVRRSVTLMYAEHIGWTSSKLITRIISLGSSLLGATTSAT